MTKTLKQLFSQVYLKPTDDIEVLQNQILLSKLLDDIIKKQSDISQRQVECQRHHIIPKSTFEYYDLPVDNTHNNVILVTLSEHKLLHLYMSKCGICDDIRRYNLQGYKMLCIEKPLYTSYIGFHTNYSRHPQQWEIYKDTSIMTEKQYFEFDIPVKEEIKPIENCLSYEDINSLFDKKPSSITDTLRKPIITDKF